MSNTITMLLWYAVGYASWLYLADMFDRHFGKMDTKWLLVPTIFFTFLGGITAIITLLCYLALEWDGKILKKK